MNANRIRLIVAAIALSLSAATGLSNAAQAAPAKATKKQTPRKAQPKRPVAAATQNRIQARPAAKPSTAKTKSVGNPRAAQSGKGSASTAGRSKGSPAGGQAGRGKGAAGNSTSKETGASKGKPAYACFDWSSDSPPPSDPKGARQDLISRMRRLKCDERETLPEDQRGHIEIVPKNPKKVWDGSYGRWVTAYQDQIKTEVFPKGRGKHTEYPDGTHIIKQRNGNLDVFNKDEEWLKVRSNGKSFRNKDGVTTNFDVDGRRVSQYGPGGPDDNPQFPRQPPTVKGPGRKVIDIDNFGYYTDGTAVDPSKNPDRSNPFSPTRGMPVGKGDRGKNNDKLPEGSLGGERAFRDLLDGKESSNDAGFGQNSNSGDHSDSNSNGNSGSDSGQGSDAGQDDTPPVDDFPDDHGNDASGSGSNGSSSSGSSGSGDTGGNSGSSGDSGGQDGGAGEGSGDSGSTGSSGTGGGDSSGSGSTGGQPPPSGLDFPDDPSTADPPKSDGFEPAPDGFGDDDNGSSNGSSGSGNSSGSSSGGDSSGDDDSDDDDSNGSGSGDEAGSASNGANVGFTPADPDRPVFQRDPATTEALRAGMKDVLKKRLGNQTTPTEDEDSGSGKGDSLIGATPTTAVPKGKSLIVNPCGERDALPSLAGAPRPGIGASPNEILPTPDAPDAPSGGSSGPPIENESRNTGGDSGVQQGGSGSGGMAPPRTTGSSSTDNSIETKLSVLRRILQKKGHSRMPTKVRRYDLPPSG